MESAVLESAVEDLLRKLAPGLPIIDQRADVLQLGMLTLSLLLLSAPLAYSETALAHVLSPRYFVEIRRTFGGPAPEETARAAKASRRQLEADEGRSSQATDALAKAERTLAERSAAL